jgi:hypothetical protein
MKSSGPFNTDQPADSLEYDVVYTVNDYWDGPREGVADYKGKPHWYKCVFDEQRDEWSNTFDLKPLDAETFALAMEAWQIWRKWEEAYHQGKVTLESHPALREDSQRKAELTLLLADRLTVESGNYPQMDGNFEAINENKGMRSYEKQWRVQWHPKGEEKS